MKGIDISNHNGNINWSFVKSSGIECAYIKATEGTTYINPYLSSDYNGAKFVEISTESKMGQAVAVSTNNIYIPLQ